MSDSIVGITISLTPVADCVDLRWWGSRAPHINLRELFEGVRHHSTKQLDKRGLAEAKIMKCRVRFDCW